MVHPVSLELKESLQPLANSLDIDLVDVRLLGTPVNRVEIIIEKKSLSESVSVKDCAELSRLSGHYLDVKDQIPNSYVLEVKSPGVKRPLLCEYDYEKYKGFKARVRFFNTEQEKYQTKEMEIIECNTTSCRFQDGDIEVKIPFDKIEKAFVIKEF